MVIGPVRWSCLHVGNCHFLKPFVSISLQLDDFIMIMTVGVDLVAALSAIFCILF